MRQKIGDRGFVKGVLVLCVLVAIVFVGVSFGKPYFRYYSLSSRTRDFLRSDTFSPEVIRKNIMAEAEELNVPLDEGTSRLALNRKMLKSGQPGRRPWTSGGIIRRHLIL